MVKQKYKQMKGLHCFMERTRKFPTGKKIKVNCLEKMLLEFPGALSLLHESNESIFHFFIPKTVNEWIQHGDHNSIKNRCHLIFAQGVGLPWFQIRENRSAIKDGDSQEMGGTCREGFSLS